MSGRKTAKNGGRFRQGNRAAAGKGRPRRAAIVDDFMAECIDPNSTSPVERRRVLLERLFTSALNPSRRDHAKLLELCLAYAYGRPRERLEMSGPGGGPIQSADTTPRPHRPTTGEMRKRLVELKAKLDDRLSPDQLAERINHYQRLQAERAAAPATPAEPAETPAPPPPGSPGENNTE